MLIIISTLKWRFFWLCFNTGKNKDFFSGVQPVWWFHLSQNNIHEFVTGSRESPVFYVLLFLWRLSLAQFLQKCIWKVFIEIMLQKVTDQLCLEPVSMATCAIYISPSKNMFLFKGLNIWNVSCTFCCLHRYLCYGSRLQDAFYFSK